MMISGLMQCSIYFLFLIHFRFHFFFFSSECNTPAGIEDGTLRDQSMVATSNYSTFVPQNARLNGDSGWCTNITDGTQSITVSCFHNIHQPQFLFFIIYLRQKLLFQYSNPRFRLPSLKSAWDLVYPELNRDVREILTNLIGCLEDFSGKIKTPIWYKIQQERYFTIY